MPPINPQITPRHKRTRLTQQKHRRPAILLRPRQSPQHILPRPLVRPLGVFLKQVCDHGGEDVPGGQRVDADVVRAPFHGEVAG